jgi:hypothetical protein
MRIEDDRNERMEPVCKFGPGGDYVSYWPPESYELAQLSTNSLTKVLFSLSKIMENLVSSESGNIAAGRTVRRRAGNKFSCGKGDLEDAVRSAKTVKPSHAASSTVIKGDRSGPGEPMLFPDDWRVGVRAGHKPKHRIRAYRRAAKKRSALVLPGQGTLFEVDFKSARSA